VGLDLKAYLEKFPDICRNKFGRTYNLEALEAHFQEHATGKRHLNTDSLMIEAADRKSAIF